MELLRVVSVWLGEVLRSAELVHLNDVSVGGVHANIRYIEKGVAVRPAAVGRQHQYPVESEVREYGRPDLLTACFCVWVGLAVAKGK